MKARMAVVIALVAIGIAGVAWWAADGDDLEQSVATEPDNATEPVAAGDDTDSEAAEVQEPVAPTEAPGFGEFPGQPYLFPWGSGFLELVVKPGQQASIEAAVSTDGVDWQPVDAAFPDLADGHISATAVAGERLVMAYGTWTPDGQPSAPVVLETQDLTTWREIELPIAESDPDLPDFVVSQTQVDRIAATADGWVAVQTSFTFVEPERLLPIDQADFEQGYGIGMTAEGIEFDPQDGETRLYTWEELGVDPDIGAALPQHEQQVTLWRARWGEDPQPVQLDGVMWLGALASNGSSYLAYVQREGGGQLLGSADGLTWEPAPSPLGEINTLAPIDGGWMAQVWRMSGPAITISTDEGASWRTVTADGLPESDQLSIHSTTSAASPGLATVAFVHDFPDSPFDGLTITYEHDGFELTVREAQFDASITIVDTATGEVVLDERYTPPTEEEIRALEESGDTEALDALRDMGPPWRQHGETTSDFVDPATGEVIVSVPWDVEAAAFDDAYRDIEDTFIDPGPPEMWLLATSDGINWLSEQLTEDDQPFIGLGAAAINGDTVVVSSGDDRRVHTLGG